MSKGEKNEGQNKQTTVEEGTQFKGTLSSTCQVMVRGVVDGDLTAPVVIVSESGTVVGNVKAQSIWSEGVLAGRVDAGEERLAEAGPVDAGELKELRPVDGEAGWARRRSVRHGDRQ